MVCSLEGGDADKRIFDWGEVIGRAWRAERAGSRMRIVFGPSAEVTAELARRSAAETACCPFVTFDLLVTASATVLTIDGPAGSEELAARFFDFSEAACPLPPSPRSPRQPPKKGAVSARPGRTVGG